jgi:mannose-6-phosphate isomerase-like protein (cupin superfamily)
MGAVAGGDTPHFESAVIEGVLGIGGGGGDGDFEPEGPELALPALAQILKAAQSMYDTPDTRSLESAPEVMAPDGSTVRPLCQISGLGSFAHFQLEPGEISKAVSHATVQEIWYIIGGTGKMWRRQDGQEPSCEDLRPGICLTIPLGTTFQFRADNASGPLRAVAVTMPPWPADSEHEARPEEGSWVTTFRH